MAILHTNTDSFEKDVINHEGVVFVDMYADWCGPCKLTEPIIEELSENPRYKDVQFVKVDIDADNALASQYGVMSIPTFMIFKNGKMVSQFVGARDRAGFESELNPLLS